MTFDEFVAKYQKVPVEEYPHNVLEKIPQPLVTCRVSTYQHASYIRQCLDGMLLQKTDFPFEILIGEDESSDGTREICIEYARKYPDLIRLFLHKRENNIRISGSPSGRFQGLYTGFHARGKYQAVCEGDDYWTDPLKLQKQADFLERNNDFAICFHRVKFFYENNPGKKTLSNINQPEVTTIRDLANGNYIHTASCFYRNHMSTIPDWYMRSIVGDYPLHLFNAQYGKIKFLKDAMAVYRIHPGGVWSAKSRTHVLERWADLLSNLKDQFSNEVNQSLNNALNFTYSRLARRYFLFDRDREKVKFYLNRIRNNNPDYPDIVLKNIKREIVKISKWITRS